MKKRSILIVLAIFVTGLLVGCAGAGGDAPAGEDQGSWPRTIVDAAGNEITLEAPPERVALLHSMYLEYFFALDTPPTASAGANVGTAMKALEEFKTLESYKGTAEIIDLGSAREINLEAILESEPDVIVTFYGHGGVEDVYDQLVQIAPVIQLDYTASWQDSIRDCAEIVGKEALAEEQIKKTEDVIGTAREALKEKKDETVIFVRSDGKGGIFALGYDRYPYYYDQETGFGLSKPESYPGEWGVISLESLAEMDPDYIIFQDYIADAKAVVDSQATSSLWNNLKAVKNDQVLYFDVSLNTTSPLSIQVAADSLMNELVK